MRWSQRADKFANCTGKLWLLVVPGKWSGTESNFCEENIHAETFSLKKKESLVAGVVDCRFDCTCELIP